MREIMELADHANRYIDQHKPWALAKDPARAAEVRAIATQGVNLFRVLMSYLAPVLPQMAQAAAVFLGSVLRPTGTPSPRRCSAAPLRPYQPLATRLDRGRRGDRWSMPRPSETPPACRRDDDASGQGDAAAPAAPDATISIEDFAKLDLRVARVPMPPRWSRAPTSCCG